MSSTFQNKARDEKLGAAFAQTIPLWRKDLAKGTDKPQFDFL